MSSSSSFHVHVTFAIRCLLWNGEADQYVHNESLFWWEMCTDPRFARWVKILYEVLMHTCICRYDRIFLLNVPPFSYWQYGDMCIEMDIVARNCTLWHMKKSKCICAAWQGTSAFSLTLTSTTWFCKSKEKTLIRLARMSVIVVSICC